MKRVGELLGSMTWDEKLAQMQVVFRPDPAELERWVRADTGAAGTTTAPICPSTG